MASLTCSLLLLFNRPGFFFFFIGLVDASWGEWPLEECGGLGNFRFCAARSAEPGSVTDTNSVGKDCKLMKNIAAMLWFWFVIHTLQRFLFNLFKVRAFATSLSQNKISLIRNEYKMLSSIKKNLLLFFKRNKYTISCKGQSQNSDMILINYKWNFIRDGSTSLIFS